ncbi:MAG: M15 family metallopeptidase [Sulfurimonas sp.]|nr:M15 family metallopeptidase [Sulfurimonas sp.]
MVFDGLRTEAEQRKNVARGVSKTNNSFHLYGLAVDLVPYVNGKPTWEEKYFKEIAIAMKKAIENSIFKIEWGYDKWKWDLPHWQITALNGKDARKVYDYRKGGYYAR